MSVHDQVEDMISARKRLNRLLASEIRAVLVKMHLASKLKSVTCLPPLRINTGEKP